jgi:hypothetical protein
MVKLKKKKISLNFNKKEAAMKKNYLTPNICVNKLCFVDVILTSNVDFADIWGTSVGEGNVL